MLSDYIGDSHYPAGNNTFCGWLFEFLCGFRRKSYSDDYNSSSDDE